MRRVLAALLLAVWTVLAPSAAPSALAAGLPANHAQFVARVIELVNIERQRAGLQPLAANGPLTRAAQGYAIVLADGSCFAHTCGSSPDQRIANAGYTNWSAWGENIAFGQSTPEDVMNAWMHSSGHRANILNANYRDIGVGLAAKNGGPLEWVQDFGKNQASGATTTPSSCATRPAFSVRTTPAGSGTLQVTVTAGRTAGAPTNVLRKIQFGALMNSTIDMPGYGTPTANTTVGIIPGTQQVTFTARRLTSASGTTVPLVLTDDCGDWRTFVGGGRTAF
jgi:uncharacterized protein YkwD